MRVKRGVSAHKKHKKLLKLAKGYQTSYHKLIKRAKEAVWHAGDYSVKHRRRRQSDFRKLWIQRINAALFDQNIKYSEFINKLIKSNIKLNRKVLAEIAVEYPQSFIKIVEFIKKS